MSSSERRARLPRARSHLWANAWPELCVGLALGAAFLVSTPLWEGPDEPYHLANILHVRKRGLYTMSHMASGLPGNLDAEGTQPPLYYLVAAILTRPVPAGVEFSAREEPACRPEPWRFQNFGRTLLPYTLRAMNLALLLATAILVARTASVAGEPSLVGTSVAMMWAVPQVAFVGTCIGNDSASMATGALLTLLCLTQWMGPSPKGMVVLGTVSLVALAVKLTLLPLVVTAGLVTLAAGPRRPWAKVVHVGCFALPSLVASGLAVVCAPQFAKALVALVKVRVLTRGVPLRPMVTLPLVWESYWARFGWMNVAVPPWAKVAGWTLTMALALGLATALARDRACRGMATVPMVACLLALGFVVGDLPHSGQAQGRHLFAAIGPFSLLGAWGLRGYLPPLRARWVANALAVATCSSALAGVLIPAYRTRPSELVVGTSCCVATHLTDPLARSPQVQTFVASHDLLCRVGVVPATKGLPVRGGLKVSVWDMSYHVPVAARVFSGGQIRDGRYLLLDFPPIPASKGRTFAIRVEAAQGGARSLWLFCTERDLCPLAQRLTGGGDLTFTSFYLPEEG